MTTIQYLDEEIKVPDNWGEIKLRNYEGFYMDRPETLRERVAMVAKICNADVELILQWPAEIFNLIIDKTVFIFREHKVAPSPSIKIGDETYVIPVEEKLTLGAYIDADQTQKDGVNVLSNILAIVCRPAGESYDPDKTEERAEMFGALSMSEVQPLLGFFLHCKHALDKRTTVFTNLRQAVELLPPNIELLRSPGTGIRLSQTWRILKYGALIMLLRYRLRRFLHLSNTSAIKITQKRRKGN